MRAKVGAKRPRKASVADLRKMHPLTWVRRVVSIGPDEYGEKMRVEIEGNAGLVSLMIVTAKLAIEKSPSGKVTPLMLEPDASSRQAAQTLGLWVVRGDPGPGLRSWGQLTEEDRQDILREYPLVAELRGLKVAMTHWYYRRSP